MIEDEEEIWEEVKSCLKDPYFWMGFGILVILAIFIAILMGRNK